MAPKPELTLLGCPLEIRHEIFGFVCEREEDPKNLLRDWFGRRELKEIAANAPPQQDDDDGEDENEDAENDGEAEEEDEDEDEDEEMDEADDDDGADGNGTGDGTTAAANATATTTTTAPAPPQISRKWRHVPNFMSLTASPPPLSLLQTCKQLNAEATNYYYDTVILRINGTVSLNHMGYFEELMDILEKTAFSPAESFRKVELTFVWDSQWLRASPDYSSIFEALLRERAHRLGKVLTKTPSLEEVRIIWHDSVRDTESVLLWENVLEEFYGLMHLADLKTEEHYDLAEGEEPNEESVLGQMRLHFEEVAQDLASGRAF